MEFRILGGLEVRDHQGRTLPFGGGKPRALLALLLLHANQPVAARRLLDLLWEGEPPESGRHSLHLLVHRLRRVLAEHGAQDRLRTLNGAYLLVVDPGELDSDRFETLLEQARGQAAAGRPDHAVAPYEEALALWRGQPLAGMDVAAFAEPAVARLDELHLAAATGRAEVLLALGQHAEAVPALEELTRRYPTQERLYRLLILALYRSGRQADALAAYWAARQRLVEGLGIEPGEELQQLQRAILAQDPSLQAPGTAAIARTSTTAAATTPAAAPVAAAEPEAAVAPSVSRAQGGGAVVLGADRPERRGVTVLAAALKLPRLVRADPEDLWAERAQVTEQLRDAVEQFGGVMHSDLGETLLATFGARRGHIDDPARAVRAALTLVSASEDPRAAIVAVGIDTGEAVVALSGPDAPPRVTGDVVSAATELAARSPAGVVRVGASTRRVTDQVVDYRPVELSDEQTGTVWEAVAVAVAAAGGGPAAVGTAVVGRERELAMLAEVLDRAREELEPQIVTVTGTPGIGKTRLLAELRQRDQEGPAQAAWYTGHSPPYGDGVTYWALAEIIKQITGIPATDDAHEADRKLRNAIDTTLGDVPEAAWVNEYLQRLVRPETAPDQDAGWRQGAFTAWSRFLETLAGAQPLVLVLEDLHWADDAMLDFVEHLIDHVEAVPLVVVCLTWPELLDRRDGWAGGARNATTVSLTPLSWAHTERLLDELLAGQERRVDLGQAQRSGLLTSSGGNPLFVEEYVRMLRGRDGRATRPADTPQEPEALLPPETIQLLISARLDDLDPGDRALLASAAVLGEGLWVDALAFVSGQEPTEVTAALRHLARREFLRRSPRSSIPGQVEYAFRHGLIRDVAYGRLLRADRAQGHRRAAEWLEALGTDRAADHAELIAHHYDQAVTYLHAIGRPATDLTDRAATALRRAGDRAVALAAYPAALRYYTRALELHPTGRPGWADLVLTREQLRLELERRVDVVSLTDARGRLEADGDHGAAAVAEMVLCAAAFARREPATAAEHERRARELVQAAPTSPASALALNELAVHLGRSNRYAEVNEFGRRALTLARQLKLRKLEALSLCALGVARVVFGDTAGLDDARHGIAILEELSSVSVPRAYIQLLGALSHIGDLDGALEVSAAIHRSAVHFGGQPAVLGYVELGRSLEHYRQGRWDEALAIAEAVLGQIQATGGRVPYMEAWCYCVRGKIRRGRGDVAGALDDSTRAYELAEHADAYVLLPAAGFHGNMLRATGREKDRDSAERIAAGVRDRIAGHLITALVGADLPDLLAACGQVPDIDDRSVACSPWLRTMYAFRDGHPGAAADIYADIGARADEALARMIAGERLVGDGRAAEAADQLRRARAFFEEVRATGYLARIDELLA